MVYGDVPMKIELKIKMLDQIYDLFEGFARTQNSVCRRRCATCCTCNVTLTTLEGYRIISDMDASAKTTLLRRIDRAANRQRFQPRLTINQIAYHCMVNQEIPQDINDPSGGPCPLLTHQECLIYRVRPFACRCMMSKTICAQSGYAEMDDAVLTIANLFNQFIEHLDRGGMTGNLIDILLFLAEPSNFDIFQSGTTVIEASQLIPNQRIPVVMVPPEHRPRVAPLLASLRKILSPLP